MLSLNSIEVIYSNVILVLKGVSLKVNQGQIVALPGGNGAGKTTTLKAISGLLKTELGEVTDLSLGAWPIDGKFSRLRTGFIRLAINSGEGKSRLEIRNQFNSPLWE